MNTKRYHIGSISVDSGQMMLCDPCYLSSWINNDFDNTVHKGMQKSGEFEFSYNGACAATLSEDQAGILGGLDAAVCSTGLGDGVYAVFIEVADMGNWGHRVSKMEIIFIEPDKF